MLIQGNSDKKRFNILLQQYSRLILQGISPENILVILLNSYKKTDFINKLKKLNPQINLEKHKILTFWGLCYNAFNDNWDYISKLTGTNSTKPNLCGLEVSQYIFKQSIKTADFSDYISKINLLHQLFRRYSLIVQNSLTNEEVTNRSKIINETFCKDAQKAIDDYKQKTIQCNSFDYLRQLAVLPQIYNNTGYFKDIKYLLADDADEYSYAFFSFIYKLIPQLNDYFIAYDKDGSTRCGYLCAYKSGINDLKQKYPQQETNIISNTKYNNQANAFYNCIKNGEKYRADITVKAYSKRMDMLENIISSTEKLLKQGIKPNDIAVITPITDDILIQTLNNNKYNLNFQFISGNEKLKEYGSIKHILAVLKLINSLQITESELKSLLIDLLGIPCRKCLEVIYKYNEQKCIPEHNFGNEKYDFAYRKLLSLIYAEEKSKNTLSQQIRIIYINLIKDFERNTDAIHYDFLLKEAESFETAFESENLVKEFIIQTENSVISENPADSLAINKDAVIVSTPQKITDYSIETKYQLWLDISNNEWMKNDTGTLYNAWVLNRDFKGTKFTAEDNIKYTRDKTARIVRKLMLLSENIIFHSSIYDNTGNENFGGISDFIEIQGEARPVFNIIPREDQKPVLEYNKGKLGIMAVPGAGKTTILLALIIKLIKQGVKPENIFVLTYMESAAKNFKERIQQAIPDSSELPNISTIHGLALRIIKDNGNYIKAGLDDKFEICDDNTKEKIVKELFYKLKLDDDKYDNYLKCISIVKLARNNKNPNSRFKEIQDFYNFYNNYNLYLKAQNLIDYDDMLYYAVKILEDNSEIRKYYQNICQYIIEDEAQDSTDIQQRLIGFLNGKYNNLVRCGDINQAITSTFTNSNPDSFKNFIKSNKKVEMVSSQRCSEPVYNLANAMVKEVIKDEAIKNAFYDIEMKGTDKNPDNKTLPRYTIFETEREEKQHVLENIVKIKKENPSASIAILLRLNSQVNEYNELFLSNGIKTAIRSDSLSQKPIYNSVIKVLKVIRNPLNNKAVTELAKEAGLKQTELEYIEQLKSPFIKQNPDDITNEKILQLYWDIDYWLNNSSLNADILVLNIGLYYSKTITDKSNAYMISAMVKRLMSETDNLSEITDKLEYAAQKPMSAYKFFEEEILQKDETPVNIMTMHKSKGDEFDYVFIPELNEENYSVSPNSIKLKSGSHFIQTIKNNVENTGIKQQEELKSEQIYETLRLLYVGITRAKQELYMSNAKNYKRRKNTKPLELCTEKLLKFMDYTF